MENNHTSSLVNLSIPKEVTTPIVAAKIQEAVLAALGGHEKIVASVVHTICSTKVDSSGKISSYSSDNKLNWLDYHVTEVIQKAVKDELVKQIEVSAQQIKDELIRQIQTKKGASNIADALLASLNGSFKNSWTSKISVDFKPRD